MPQRDTSVGLARLQLLLMAAVILGFVASTAAVAAATRAIGSDVDLITASAMPSVLRLSAARGELHRFDRSLEQYVRAAEQGERPTGEKVRERRETLESSLADADLPSRSRDPGLHARILARLADHDRSIDGVLAAVGARDWPAADRSLDDEWRHAQDLDDALAELVAFNAAEGDQLGLHVGLTRRHAFRLAFVLDGLVGSAAALATVLAAITLRRSVRHLESARFDAERRASYLQERSSELELFAGRVAHDIQSPLMAVGLGIQMCKARLAADAAALAIVDRALRSLSRVQAIVSGLLDFACAGARPDKEARADLREGVQGVVDDVRSEAERARVELLVEPFDDLQVACARGVLSSLIGNLVRNAVKYMGESPQRRVTVRVREAAGGLLRVEVEDTGPGIPADMREEIFEPFVRVGGSSAPGAGLGLATVKKLAVAHGGRAGCRSGAGSGSVFWFELPRVVARGAARALRGAPAAGQGPAAAQPATTATAAPRVDPDPACSRR